MGKRPRGEKRGEKSRVWGMAVQVSAAAPEQAATEPEVQQLQQQLALMGPNGTCCPVLAKLTKEGNRVEKFSWWLQKPGFGAHVPAGTIAVAKVQVKFVARKDALAVQRLAMCIGARLYNGCVGTAMVVSSVLCVPLGVANNKHGFDVATDHVSCQLLDLLGTEHSIGDARVVAMGGPEVGNTGHGTRGAAAATASRKPT